jgi:hypothetical protein
MRAPPHGSKFSSRYSDLPHKAIADIGLSVRLTGDREGHHLSSTETIKNSDNGRAAVATIMPCVGGLIIWFGFPERQCGTDGDRPFTDGFDLDQCDLCFDGNEPPFKQK